MFCNNCQQDIGNRILCPHCGYNPQMDGEGATAQVIAEQVYPRPIHIVKRRSGNGKAKAAFILSFFGFLILPGILSFIFGLAGFFQAKKCRSGRFMSIIAMVIDILWVCLYTGIIYSLVK